MIELDKENYVNLTKICIENNINLDNWLSEKSIREYLIELEKTSKIKINNLIKIVKKNKYGHIQIALKLASFISTEFYLFCLEEISNQKKDGTITEIFIYNDDYNFKLTEKSNLTLYFVKFFYEKKELFKVGVTDDINQRLKTLKTEFKTDSIILLKSFSILNPVVEKEMKFYLTKKYPHLKFNPIINDVEKTECFLFDICFLGEINNFSKKYNSIFNNINKNMDQIMYEDKTYNINFMIELIEKMDTFTIDDFSLIAGKIAGKIKYEENNIIKEYEDKINILEEKVERYKNKLQTTIEEYNKELDEDVRLYNDLARKYNNLKMSIRKHKEFDNIQIEELNTFYPLAFETEKLENYRYIIFISYNEVKELVERVNETLNQKIDIPEDKKDTIINFIRMLMNEQFSVKKSYKNNYLSHWFNKISRE